MEMFRASGIACMVSPSGRGWCRRFMRCWVRVNDFGVSMVLIRDREAVCLKAVSLVRINEFSMRRQQQQQQMARLNIVPENSKR